IRYGLAKPDQEIRCLPAYLRRPAGNLSGRAVALDVGGTHMRAAEVEMLRGHARLVGPVGENDLMLQATKRDFTRDEFFASQAALVARATTERNLIVGYCFSYPATITPDREAMLIEWTKGIRIRDVEGQKVGALLRDALRAKGKNASAIPVLNDTVASLLAGAALATQFERPIGVIVGTGTNMAGFFPVRDIAKLGAPSGWRDDELMAVNLESGDFTPRDVLTPWDDALDASLPPEQRDRQRFEKALSGAYLPRLLREVAGRDASAKAGFDPDDQKIDAGTVVALRGDAVLGEAATALIDRSADLIAAGLAALIASYGSPARTGILVEGTLFHKTPGYSGRVAKRLKELAPLTRVDFIPNEEGGVPANMLGAAGAALSP
ncbi:MAG: hexokinase family protein, partial [Stellaceae bacterium]